MFPKLFGGRRTSETDLWVEHKWFVDWTAQLPWSNSLVGAESHGPWSATVAKWDTCLWLTPYTVVTYKQPVVSGWKTKKCTRNMRTSVGHAAACCGALVAWTEMSEVARRFVFQGRPCQSTVKQHGWKGQRRTVTDASQVGWTINIQCSNKYMDERRPQFVWSLQAKKECFSFLLALQSSVRAPLF